MEVLGEVDAAIQLQTGVEEKVALRRKNPGQRVGPPANPS